MPIFKVVNFADTLQKGDLTAEVDITGNDEIIQLQSAMKSFVNKLNQLITNVRGASNNVYSNSTHINSVAQQLSLGATYQAASAEQTPLSMEEMSPLPKNLKTRQISYSKSFHFFMLTVPANLLKVCSRQLKNVYNRGSLL